MIKAALLYHCIGLVIAIVPKVEYFSLKSTNTNNNPIANMVGIPIPKSVQMVQEKIFVDDTKRNNAVHDCTYSDDR